MNLRRSTPYGLSLIRSSGIDEISFGPYAMKSFDQVGEKLEQFSQGTKFFLGLITAPGSDQKTIESDFVALFKDRGMTLELPRK